MKKMFNSKGIALIALAIAAVFLLNFGLALIPGSAITADLTTGKRGTPSDAAEPILSALNEEVTLYVIDNDGREMIYNAFLDELDAMSDCLTVKSLKHEDSIDLFKKAGYNVSSFTEDQWERVQYGILAESRYRAVYLDFGEMFFYNTNNETLNSMGISEMTPTEYSQTLQQMAQLVQQGGEYAEQYMQLYYILLDDTNYYFKGEEKILQLVEFVSTPILPAQYILTGHGETDLQGLIMADLLEMYNESWQTLDLTTLDAIPEDASSLLILAPTGDFSEDEIAILKAYLARGGQITFVSNEENLSMPNLMGLMADYGMSATPGAVGEEVPVKEEAESDSDVDTGTDTDTDTDADAESESENDTETEGETDGDDTVRDTFSLGASDTDADTDTDTTEEPVRTEISYTVDVLANEDHEALMMLAGEKQFAPAITNGNAMTLNGDASPSLLVSPLLTTSDKAFIGDRVEEKGRRIVAAAAETADGGRIAWYTGADSFLVSGKEMGDDGSPLYNNFCLYLTMGWTSTVYETNLPEIDPILYTATYLNTRTVTHLWVSALVFVAVVLILSVVAFFLWNKRKNA